MSSPRARKSLLVLMGTLVVMAVLGVLVAEGPESGDEPEQTRILIVGDSITQGSAGDYTWRYRLWKHLRANGARVDFVGPRDDLYDNVSETFGSHDYADRAFDQEHAARWGTTVVRARNLIREQVAAYEPDVVLVLLGTNDLGYWKKSPEEVAAGLRELVRRARLVRPEVSLVVGRVPEEGLPGAAELNAQIENLAEGMSSPESEIAVASADSGFTESEDTWSDFHPNARGELKIAAAMADALSALGVGSPYPRPLPDVPLGPRTAPVLTAAAGDGEATLSWTVSPGATDYYVWIRDVTTGDPWKRLPFPVAGTSWPAKGLENRHTYWFRLQPEKGRWASRDIRSNIVTVTPEPAMPGPVRSVTAVPTGSGAALSWTPADRASGYYVWKRDATAEGEWSRLPGPLATTSFTAEGLAVGSTYEFSVQPTNNGVDGPRSDSVAVLAAAPVG